MSDFVDVCEPKHHSSAGWYVPCLDGGFLTTVSTLSNGYGGQGVEYYFDEEWDAYLAIAGYYARSLRPNPFAAQWLAMTLDGDAPAYVGTRRLIL